MASASRSRKRPRDDRPPDEKRARSVPEDAFEPSPGRRRPSDPDPADPAPPPAAAPLADDPAALEARLKEIPTSPGVYLLKDARGRTIYIGKAKNLRSRVRSYFRERFDDGRLLYPFLVRRVADVDVVATANEKEALLLENHLIKRHQPRYNVKLADDKTYLSIKVTTDEPWPRVVLVRKQRKRGGTYFGPYDSATAVRATVKILKRYFPLRTCSNAEFRQRKRPCIEYDMGRCRAPCVGLESEESYARSVENVILFLRGKAGDLLDRLKSEMATRSAAWEFEEAARIRDRIAAIERTLERQAIARPSLADRDAFGIALSPGFAHVEVVQVRDGKVCQTLGYPLALHRDEAGPDETDAEAEPEPEAVPESEPESEPEAVPESEPESEPEPEPEPEPNAETAAASASGPDRPGAAGPRAAPRERPAEVLNAFLGQFYADESRPAPAELVLPVAVEDAAALEELLGERRGSRVRVIVPERGERGELVRLATENAELALRRSAERTAAMTAATAALQRRLGLRALPRRIDCFDMSNIQGAFAVGAMVRFEDGAPDKNRYRRFKIRTVGGADDFSMMREVLRRRYGKLEDPARRKRAAREGDLPDLVVVDGGKGQLSVATAVLADIGLTELDVVGLAKGRHRRGDERRVLERVFRPGEAFPTTLPPDSAECHLLERVRDEAHRFAITYHRELRRRSALRAGLEDVPGIGPKRRRALLRELGNLAAIREASIDRLAAVAGMSRPAAEAVHAHLRAGRTDDAAPDEEPVALDELDALGDAEQEAAADD